MLIDRIAIQRRIDDTTLYIKPFTPEKLRLASYIISLSGEYRRWKQRQDPIRLWAPTAADNHLEDPSNAAEFMISPGEFILASSVEYIGISSDLFAQISPLSHIARFGLSIHCGADFVNPGFGSKAQSRLTFELHNCNSSPLILTAGMPIAHLKFGEISSSSNPEHLTFLSVYEGADPLTSPRFYEEWSTKVMAASNG